jgi:hypothetical protein
MIDVRSGCSASLLLGGGRSPAHWQNAITEDAWRLAQVRRASRWVTSLDKSRPRLIDGTLFGDGLDAATRASRRSLIEPVPARRVAGLRADPPAKPTSERARQPAAPSESMVWKKNADLSQLAAQADYELLSWLAERRPARDRKDAVVPDGVRRVTASLEMQPIARKANTKPGSRSSSTGVPQAHQAVVDLLVKRASAALSVFASPAESKRGLRLLSDQWSTSLKGPEAPSELLNGCTLQDSEVGSVHPGNRESETASDSAGVPGNERPRKVARMADTATANNSVSASAWSEPRPSPSPAEDLLSSIPLNDREPLLPPLIPSESGGRPASLLRGDTAEAASFDWNLGALAVGIKRILDEEARRHGIDV